MSHSLNLAKLNFYTFEDLSIEDRHLYSRTVPSWEEEQGWSYHRILDSVSFHISASFLDISFLFSAHSAFLLIMTIWTRCSQLSSLLHSTTWKSVPEKASAGWELQKPPCSGTLEVAVELTQRKLFSFSLPRYILVLCALLVVTQVLSLKIDSLTGRVKPNGMS